MASATPGLDPGAKLSEILLVADTDDLRAVVKAICARYAGGVDVAWDVMADRKYGLSEKMARLHRYERCGKVFDEDANDQEACRWHRFGPPEQIWNTRVGPIFRYIYKCCGGDYGYTVGCQSNKHYAADDGPGPAEELTEGEDDIKAEPEDN